MLHSSIARRTTLVAAGARCGRTARAEVLVFPQFHGAEPILRTGSAARALCATLILALVACADAPTSPVVPAEPAIWRTYATVRYDDQDLPVVWRVLGADTTRLVSSTIELRVDGTTAWRSAYLVTSGPDTLREAVHGTYAVFGDSLRIEALRLAVADSTLLVEDRLRANRFFHYRLR